MRMRSRICTERYRSYPFSYLLLLLSLLLFSLPVLLHVFFCCYCNDFDCRCSRRRRITVMTWWVGNGRHVGICSAASDLALRHRSWGTYKLRSPFGQLRMEFRRMRIIVLTASAVIPFSFSCDFFDCWLLAVGCWLLVLPQCRTCRHCSFAFVLCFSPRNSLISDVTNSFNFLVVVCGLFFSFWFAVYFCVCLLR